MASFLVRVCAVSSADAITSTTVEALEGVLTLGSAIDPNSVISLVPVVQVMNNIWHVRSTQSAGYVRVASQKALNRSHKRA